MYVYKSMIIEIIDGDSLVMAVDLGFYISTMIPVRLTGLDYDKNNPIEVRREKQACDYLVDFAENSDTLIMSTTRCDKSGIWLAEITHETLKVNEHMQKLNLLRGAGPSLGIVH